MSKARWILGAMVLLFGALVFTPAPPAQANMNRCDACGAECQMDYVPGASDCGGPPRGCLRITVCG